MRIVANQAKNSRRGRSRREVRHARHAALRPTEADCSRRGGDVRSRRRALFAAVAQLRDRDRAVIACRYFADMSEAEAASSLGVAPGTVKSRTARALDRLRSELGDD
jgi:RNA polymerase sigma-70 factor (ECF subfamily)